VLRANQAVRLGLRAASRNPELPFAKALIDQGGNLLAVLPVGLAIVLVVAMANDDVLRAAEQGLEVLAALSWSTLGAIATALILAFTASLSFWAGALPLLAADAELGRRPPPGNFTTLVSRGAARAILAGALGWGLSSLFTVACAIAFLWGAGAAVFKSSPAMLAAAALAGAAGVLGSILLDLLARLTLVRAAVFGDPATSAFARAASLFGQRSGALLVVTAAFIFLELIVASVATTLTATLSGVAWLDPAPQVIALAPRAAVAVATGAVFAWLEVGRMGALAALAADAEGLIEAPAPPEPPPTAELVVDAIPVDD
jgi:hypothetical protein